MLFTTLLICHAADIDGVRRFHGNARVDAACVSAMARKRCRRKGAIACKGMHAMRERASCEAR